MNEFRKKVKENVVLFKKFYSNHCKDYDESNIRDICDIMISSKNNGLENVKKSTTYLSDNSLSLALMDVVFAGVDQTVQVFR